MSNELVTITHSASGAAATVHPFGATVVSYQPAAASNHPHGRQVLFVSSEAKHDGSKAIRGGIPVVFPIFGPPPTTDSSSSTMPQHGFARVNYWKVRDLYDNETEAGATFTLTMSDVSHGRGEHNPWSAEQALLDGTSCQLTYHVMVSAEALTCTLTIMNTGGASFDFQCLLHTYFSVDKHAAQDASQCFVKGLGGYSFSDKVDASKSGTVQDYDETVVLDGEVDRVYIHPDDHPVLKVKIGVGDGRTIEMDAYGQIDEQIVPVSCVVWNPHADKAASMSDFGNNEYKDMICVEPGLLGHQPLLAPRKQATLTQTIRIK